MFVILSTYTNYDESDIDDAVDFEVIPKLFATKAEAFDFIREKELPKLADDYRDAGDLDDEDEFYLEPEESDSSITVEIGECVYDFVIIEVN